jgi:hypothetical protein
MDSLMTRAVIGFFILNFGLAVLAGAGLGVAIYLLDDNWWIKALVGVGGVVAEFGIYFSTIHEPIYDWIREPKYAKKT